MRTTSRMVRQSRMAKQSRRWGPTKENAHREVDSGWALRPAADSARFVPSGRGLRDPRQ
jgi:hypothetical protein